HLAGGDLDGGDGGGDLGVPQDVVGAGRLLDEVRLELGQLLHPGDGLVDLPDLVGVGHQAPLVADLLADDARAPDVVLQVATDLDLEVLPAARHQAAAQRPQLVVRVPQPARRGGVGGVPVALHVGD